MTPPLDKIVEIDPNLVYLSNLTDGGPYEIDIVDTSLGKVVVQKGCRLGVVATHSKTTKYVKVGYFHEEIPFRESKFFEEKFYPRTPDPRIYHKPYEVPSEVEKVLKNLRDVYLVRCINKEEERRELARVLRIESGINCSIRFFSE